MLITKHHISKFFFACMLITCMLIICFTACTDAIRSGAQSDPISETDNTSNTLEYPSTINYSEIENGSINTSIEKVCKQILP